MNIIQKDITFEFKFSFYFWNVKTAIKNLLKKYDVEDIQKSWSWKQPFSRIVSVRVNIKHDVDIEAMRKKQYELNGGGINVT